MSTSTPSTSHGAGTAATDSPAAIEAGIKANDDRAFEESLGAMSPFEVKNLLVKMAKKGDEGTTRTLLNAGRGNPNWITTLPREAFFLLGAFAMEEARRTMDEPDFDLAGMPAAEGAAARFLAFLDEHGREKRSAGTAGEGRTGKLRRSLRSEIGEQVLELSLGNAVLQADECDVMQDGEPLQIDDTQRAGGQLARHSRLVQKRNSQIVLHEDLDDVKALHHAGLREAVHRKVLSRQRVFEHRARARPRFAHDEPLVEQIFHAHGPSGELMIGRAHAHQPFGAEHVPRIRILVEKALHERAVYFACVQQRQQLARAA